MSNKTQSGYRPSFLSESPILNPPIHDSLLQMQTLLLFCKVKWCSLSYINYGAPGTTPTQWYQIGPQCHRKKGKKRVIAQIRLQEKKRKKGMWWGGKERPRYEEVGRWWHCLSARHEYRGLLRKDEGRKKAERCWVFIFIKIINW